MGGFLLAVGNKGIGGVAIGPLRTGARNTVMSSSISLVFVLRVNCFAGSCKDESRFQTSKFLE